MGIAIDGIKILKPGDRLSWQWRQLWSNHP